MAIVMGPTPPGFGVTFAGNRLHLREIHVSHEPRSSFPLASAIRLTPTSMTTAPGLTISALTNSGSAHRANQYIRSGQWLLISRVANGKSSLSALACSCF